MIGQIVERQGKRKLREDVQRMCKVKRAKSKGCKIRGAEYGVQSRECKVGVAKAFLASATTFLANATAFLANATAFLANAAAFLANATAFLAYVTCSHVQKRGASKGCKGRGAK